MAKYVLLAFNDDLDADNFVACMTVYEGTDWLNDVMKAIGRGWIRGVWKKPTKFCECTENASTLRKRGWTRGKKYGWWVCSICHKPSKDWGRGDEWYRSLGTNLIPITEEAPEYRGPLHKQHPGYIKETSNGLGRRLRG